MDFKSTCTASKGSLVASAIEPELFCSNTSATTTRLNSALIKIIEITLIEIIDIYRDIQWDIDSLRSAGTKSSPRFCNCVNYCQYNPLAVCYRNCSGFKEMLISLIKLTIPSSTERKQSVIMEIISVSFS